MARNYAALPYDYLEEMEALNDAEFGRLTRALLAYSMTGEQIALCGNERFYAKRVMAQEDRFKANYKEVSDARREAGKAGADARWQNGKCIFANGKNNKATVVDGKNGYTETKTDTETNALPSNDGKRDMREARFIPPSISDVEQYCREKGYHINAEQFVCFYAQKGWMVGKNRMKDWKRAVQGWETRRKDEQQNAQHGFSYDYGSTEDSL